MAADEVGGRSIRIWVVAVIGLGALATLGIGGAMTLQRLAATPPALQKPAAPTNAPSASTPRASAPAVPDDAYEHKPSSAFGLPAYPSAFSYFSLEDGKERGSSAYSVKKGTAQEIMGFYARKLGEQGWRFVWQVNAEERPTHVPNAPSMRGKRGRWMHEKNRRQLTVLALDDVQKGRTAQVVMSWSPLATKGTGTMPAPLEEKKKAR